VRILNETGLYLTGTTRKQNIQTLKPEFFSWSPFLRICQDWLSLSNRII